MGLFSSVKKAVKKVTKGVTKVFKKVIKPVKKFASSKLGKIALAGLAIYTGGIAFGAFEAPAWMGSVGTSLQSAGTAIKKGASDLVTGLTGQSGTAGTVTGSTAAPTAEFITPPPEVIGAAPSGAAAPTGSWMGSSATVGYEAQPGLMSQISEGIGKGANAVWEGIGEGANAVWEGAKSAGTWMEKNPILTKMGGEMLSAAMAPDPVEEQLKLEQQRRDASYAWRNPTPWTDFTRPVQTSKPMGLVQSAATGAPKYQHSYQGVDENG